MAATANDIRRWFDRAISKGAEYMIVVCDTYDWDDYPVGTTADKFETNYRQFDGVNMQKVMEVYDLSMDREEQIREKRAFHYPPGFQPTRR